MWLESLSRRTTWLRRFVTEISRCVVPAPGGKRRGIGVIYKVLQDSFALTVWATLGPTTNTQVRSFLMARHVFRLNREGEAAFDIVSYGRRGPGQPTHFTREQIE